MSKGKSLGQCKTCDSEIIEFFNDGVFRSGECDACERHRYETQTELLETLRAISNDCEDWLKDWADMNADDLFAAIKNAADTAIANAYEKAA